MVHSHLILHFYLRKFKIHFGVVHHSQAESNNGRVFFKFLLCQLLFVVDVFQCVQWSFLRSAGPPNNFCIHRNDFLMPHVDEHEFWQSSKHKTPVAHAHDSTAPHHHRCDGSVRFERHIPPRVYVSNYKRPRISWWWCLHVHNNNCGTVQKWPQILLGRVKDCIKKGTSLINYGVSRSRFCQFLSTIWRG